MNCLDINRIANAGSFSRLDAVEKAAAENHARTCPQCAPMWAVHAQLAGLQIPPMPPELTARCRMLAASSSQQRQPPWRRLTLIGGLVALAAAAGVWMWNGGGAYADASLAEFPVAAATPGESAFQSPPPLAAQEAGLTQAHPPTVEDVSQADAELPRVLPPAGIPPDLDKSLLLLRKAMEKHPELVEGPPLDDSATFIVAVALRTNGMVLDSAAELASPDTFSEVSSRVPRILPLGSGERIFTGFRKGPLPEGSTLRAHVMLSGVFFPDDTDLSRTDVRVREILGHRYDELMRPSSSEEISLLTVLLSDDGRVLREKRELITMQTAGVVMGLGSAARPEEILALQLGIDASQIGLVGSTILERGTARIITDGNGLTHFEGREALVVRYAWTRRIEEPAAVTRPRVAIQPQADFDQAAALVVVERLMPDVFSHGPPSLEEFQVSPTVVFTADGAVLRTGRVQTRNGVTLDSLLQEQVVPGVRTVLHRSVRLTNKAGATAQVTFAWAQ